MAKKTKAVEEMEMLRTKLLKDAYEIYQKGNWIFKLEVTCGTPEEEASLYLLKNGLIKPHDIPVAQNQRNYAITEYGIETYEAFQDANILNLIKGIPCINCDSENTITRITPVICDGIVENKVQAFICKDCGNSI